MNLFTYGTLMDREVWNRVAQEPCGSRRAVLHDYEVRCLQDAPYPGLVECPGAGAPGLIYFDVSAAAMERLDEYEGDLYIRIEAGVELEDGAAATAQVYLVHPDRRDVVLSENWHAPGVRDF